MRSQPKKKPVKENNGIKIRQFTVYEPDFKKAVVCFAEEKGTSEAKKRYGVSESCIRRWRKIENKRKEIAEQTAQANIQQTVSSTKVKKVKEISNEQEDLANKLDCMPLNERLKNSQVEQEPLLQSQPLSPTKLKVTRQSKLQNLPKPQPFQQPPSLPPPVEEISLKWNSYQSNMQNMFPHLLSKEQYVDATLVAEGQSIKCHRVILSSCSPYFEETLNGISPFQHPVIFLKDVPFWILKTLCDFMYTGEVQILQTKLEELLVVAENLKIKGLAEKENRPKEEIPSEPPKLIKQEIIEETKEKEKEADKKEVKERRKRSIPTHIPLLKCERLKLLHNSEKALLKRLKVQFKNSQKKNELPTKNVVKEPLSKTDILDPYDLLEPVYEEVQKETKPTQSCKAKDTKSIPVKKNSAKKVKKRKISDDRDESPSPILTKKGTRSRPLKKIAKYSDPGPPNISKEVESPIVHEPHTTQADPLLALEDIKTEPLDLDDENIIEIEDNVVGFSDNVSLQDDIISNYETLLVNFEGDKKSRKKSKGKISEESDQIDSPVLMEVHNILEKDDMLKIVDVTEIKSSEESRHSEFLEEDPLNITQNVENITITNIQSLVETKEDSSESISNEMGFRISEIQSQTKESTCKKTEEGILGFTINQEEIDKEKLDEDSPTCSSDVWNSATKSDSVDPNIPTGNDTVIPGSSPNKIINLADVEMELTEKNDCDNNQSDSSATDNMIDKKILLVEKMDVNIIDNENIEHSTKTQNEEASLIRVIALEKLEIQSNQNEPTNTSIEVKMNNDEKLDTESNEILTDNPHQDEEADVDSVFLETESKNTIEYKINKESTEQVSEADSEHCLQMQTEDNSNTDNATFHYNLDCTENKDMPKYDDGIPLIENQNTFTPGTSNYIVDNKNIENENASNKYVEKALSSNTDNLKGCEEFQYDPNIGLGEVGTNEDSLRNIAAYASSSFQIAQVMSDGNITNEDNFRYFKDKDTSYLESEINESVDPIKNEIDTIVSDLTQIVGESQNLSESNVDNVQDIEESLANLLK